MNSDVRLHVFFFKTASGNEPVREWLLQFDRKGRRKIGEDIKTVQFGWPLGMPLIRKLGPDLWEVRSHLDHGVARVIFTVQNIVMVLLNGFVKKSQKTPVAELVTARKRLTQYKDLS